MKKIYIFTLLLFILFTQISFAKINVVTSTSDLAYFARVVGGNLVQVQSIASPTADLHYIEVRPSYMMKVKKADIVLKVGLDLDLWIDKIIDGSRNSDLHIVDCSKNIKPFEIPNFKLDASHGDLHRFGNPHYWLTPDNIAPIILAIMEGFIAVDPKHTDQYKINITKYLDELKESIPELQKAAAILRGKEVIYYHNSWSYFNDFIGLIPVAFIEPFPGVPASPSHMTKIIKQIKEHKIRIIIIDPFSDRRVPEKIADKTGAKVVVLYPSVGGRNKDETYVEWLKGNINALEEILR